MIKYGVELDRSVNRYFCGELFDERDGYPADEYNGNDGGAMCPDCQKLKIKDEESQEDPMTERARIREEYKAKKRLPAPWNATGAYAGYCRKKFKPSMRRLLRKIW